MAEKKKAFSISDYIIPENVSNLDTASTATIIDVPIQSIQINEKNFYDTSNVGELVKSIALNGLIEPIIVMPTEPIPGAEGPAYRIISGHRRFSAWQDLASEDSVKYAAIPAIVRSPANDIMEELLLIEANRATRVISSADTMKQAERYKDLLVKLKESGVEIPGRLRDVLADAMQISATRLARLDVIRKGLIPSYMKAFEAGTLNESAAYEIARLYPTLQEKLSQILKDPNKMTAFDIPNYGKRLNIYFGPELKCEKVRDPKLQTATYCTHGEKMWEVSKSKTLYSMCSGCCSNCWSKSSCKNVCPVVAPDIEKAKAEREERERADKAQREQKKVEADNYASLFWSRAKAAREASGLSAEDAFRKITATCNSRNCWWYVDDDKELIEQENGAPTDPENDDYSRDDETPNDFDMIIAFADAYGCSIDYLVGRSDNPAIDSSKLTWRPLDYDPPAEDQNIIVLKSDGSWREMSFSSETTDGNGVIGWIPFPEVPDAIQS